LDGEVLEDDDGKDCLLLIQSKSIEYRLPA
jgi:hypothetical protein